MASFKEVDEVCVQKALMELQAKSCEQDQIPTKIVNPKVKPSLNLIQNCNGYKGIHLSQLHLEGCLRFGVWSMGNMVFKGW